MAVFYRQGFARTTLADIAAETGVPLGNFYYYFRTKEALGLAVIEHYRTWLRSRFQSWEESNSDPLRRLDLFIEMTIEDADRLAASGCPIGSLVQELAKEDGTLGAAASDLFSVILTFLEGQFSALGRADHAADLALSLLAIVQGASLITNAFHQPTIQSRVGQQAKRWIRTQVDSATL